MQTLIFFKAKTIGIFFVLITFKSVCGLCQQDTIRFETKLSWQQILSKAKSERKNIFIDCYTTWCVPCKQMDKYVFTSPKVASFYNNTFISVKIQMDQTPNDNANIKEWYNEADRIKSHYNVLAYPTYIFLSYDGIPLHKATGLHNEQAFVELGRNALNPEKQYYRNLAKFKPGVMDTSEMKGLARSLKYSGIELAEKIAKDYLLRIPKKEIYKPDNLLFIQQFNSDSSIYQIGLRYISSLREKNFLSKSTIEFVREFTKSTKQKGFRLFFRYQKVINKIIGDTNYSQNFIIGVITRNEFFDPIFKPAAKRLKTGLSVDSPNWESLYKTLNKKYGKFYAINIILDAKIQWFTMTKEWEKYSKSLVEKIDQTYMGKDFNLPGIGWNLNNDCWNIFLRSNDKKILNRAIMWMEKSMQGLNQKYDEALDTYANLLYKVGRVKEALIWQEKAVKLSPNNKGIQTAWEKMNRQLPTWHVPTSDEKKQ